MKARTRSTSRAGRWCTTSRPGRRTGTRRSASEKPDIYVDTTGVKAASLGHPDAGHRRQRAVGKPDAGHMQLSTIVRDIGINSVSNGDDNVFGWGFNLGGTYNVTASDTLLALGELRRRHRRHGQRLELRQQRRGVRCRAAKLEALPYCSGMLAGLTHKWTPKWRSTATYGYVEARQHRRAGRRRLSHDPLRQRQPRLPGAEAAERRRGRCCTATRRRRTAPTATCSASRSACCTPCSIDRPPRHHRDAVGTWRRETPMRTDRHRHGSERAERLRREVHRTPRQTHRQSVSTGC